MTRVAKHPEERRKELIDIAAGLFLEKGYSHTSISDIVRAAKVAQGTFYYHFASKSDMLDAVLEQFLAETEAELKQTADEHREDSKACVEAAINRLFDIVGRHDEILHAVHQESNAVLHDRLVRMTMDRLVPFLTAIVAEGDRKNVFMVPCPYETVEVIMAALFWHFHQPGLRADSKRRARVRITLEHMLNRLLSLSQGQFSLSME